ncbi:MAG: PEP-CTERM sorting domain-containing protein [Phycisphaerae bacterium]|nr:PEP-CTERM sorting domain-containing protein [Phycisphaerae bacterium]
MKGVCPISIGTRVLILAFFVLSLFLAGPGQCQTAGVALLLQQSPAGGGVVSPEVGVHHYAEDEEVTLIAVPKPGYQFVYWLGDVLDPTANKTTALLDKPKIIIAIFQRVESGQLAVGQNRPAGGGGGAIVTPGQAISPSAVRTGSPGGGGGSTPTTPTEGDDPFPPDDPPLDPPDDPYDPPDVPEPATGLLLLGGLALLRNRRSATAGRRA